MLTQFGVKICIILWCKCCLCRIGSTTLASQFVAWFNCLYKLLVTILDTFLCFHNFYNTSFSYSNPLDNYPIHILVLKKFSQSRTCKNTKLHPKLLLHVFLKTRKSITRCKKKNFYYWIHLKDSCQVVNTNFYLEYNTNLYSQNKIILLPNTYFK